MEEVTDSVVPKIANIREEWHWVKPGLEAIYHNSPDIDEIPEDVYAACVAGNAHLWTAPDGFVITMFTQDGHRRGLQFWHSWAKEMGGKHSSRYHDFFEQIAANNGCSYLQTETVHQPLVDHFLDNLGYRVKTQILVKDIG